MLLSQFIPPSPSPCFHESVLYVCISTAAAAAAIKSLQSCPTLCDPVDCSPPGSAIPGVLQARTLEWVAISFSSISTPSLKIDPSVPFF